MVRLGNPQTTNLHRVGKIWHQGNDLKDIRLQKVRLCKVRLGKGRERKVM